MADSAARVSQVRRSPFVWVIGRSRDQVYGYLDSRRLGRIGIDCRGVWDHETMLGFFAWALEDC